MNDIELNRKIDTAAVVARKALRLTVNVALCVLCACALYAAIIEGMGQHWFTALMFGAVLGIINTKKQ